MVLEHFSVEQDIEHRKRNLMCAAVLVACYVIVDAVWTQTFCAEVKEEEFARDCT